MKKVLAFIKQHLGAIAITSSTACLFALIGAGYWLIAPAILLAAYAWLVAKVLRHPFTPADGAVWFPPAPMLVEAVEKASAKLVSTGYGKKDYRKHRHDCEDYIPAQAHEIHDNLLEASKDIPEAQEKGIPMYPFSFGRSDKDARHRVLQLQDDNGLVYYVETYPIFDGKHSANGLFRLLTVGEEMNGHRIS